MRDALFAVSEVGFSVGIEGALGTLEDPGFAAARELWRVGGGTGYALVIEPAEQQYGEPNELIPAGGVVRERGGLVRLLVSR